MEKMSEKVAKTNI